MGRRAATALHLALVLLGVLLYVIFVLPRWWVLTGDIPSGLATAGRLATGVPIALAALPVLAILRSALARKAKTPELALRLRAWSAVLHVVAGGLILLAAIVEIWLRLRVGGPYLFAVYGAAASIAVLAVLALYLSFVAEKPPAAPKPPKPKKVKAEKATAEKKPRGKKNTTEASADATETADETESVTVEETEDATVETIDTANDAAADETSEPEPAVATEPAAEPSGSLRNKRPTGKRRSRLGR